MLAPAVIEGNIEKLSRLALGPFFLVEQTKSTPGIQLRWCDVHGPDFNHLKAFRDVTDRLRFLGSWHCHSTKGLWVVLNQRRKGKMHSNTNE